MFTVVCCLIMIVGTRSLQCAAGTEYRECVLVLYSSHDLRVLTEKSEVVLYRMREYTDRPEK